MRALVPTRIPHHNLRARLGPCAMPKGALDPPIAALGSPESERQRLKDLGSLLVDAQERFGDVAWRDDASGKTVYAHKCIVYARATGPSTCSLSCPRGSSPTRGDERHLVPPSSAS